MLCNHSHKLTGLSDCPIFVQSLRAHQRLCKVGSSSDANSGPVQGKENSNTECVSLLFIALGLNPTLRSRLTMMRLSQLLRV